MKIRIGIIGPNDTIEKIADVTREFENVAEFIFKEYQQYQDIVNLTKEIQQVCDILFFSGEAPYSVSLNSGILDKPALYIPRDGTSFYRTIWEIQKKLPGFSKISSDVVSPTIIDETMKELEIENVKSFYLKYNFGLSHQAIFEFHKSLWDEGKLDACITGFTNVFESLSAAGVQVFKVYPTKPLIRETIQKAILLGTVKKEQEGQIAIQIVRIRNQSEEETSEYSFMLLRNQLEAALIRYTQKNFGAIFPFGRDEFLIFTNRGAIQDIHEIFADQFENSSGGVLLSSGIGLGHTVYDAERNARHALSYALHKNVNCLYLKDGAGDLTGPITKDSDQWLSFENEQSEDEALWNIVEKSGISATYIQKLRGLSKKLSRLEVDAKTVADYLGISQRSARRILTDLVDSGFADVIDEVSQAQTGRPRKIYFLKIKAPDSKV